MQTLIYGTALPMVGQSAVSFTQIEVLPEKNKDNGFSDQKYTTEFVMDFCTTNTDKDRGTVEVGWYRMNFRKDFGQYLELFNRLPYASVEEAMIEHREKDIETNALMK